MLLSAAAIAQTSPALPQYTIRSETRVVLTDIAVTDNPVHGLRAADFGVLDNKLPQKIASFEEHSA
jgi:hypothetical protein